MARRRYGQIHKYPEEKLAKIMNVYVQKLQREKMCVNNNLFE